VEPSAFWMPSNGLVGHDAVERGDGLGAVEQVLIGAQVGNLGLHVAARGGCLRLGLVDASYGLGQGGHIEVIGGLLGVEILLGQNAILVEGLGAVPVELLLFEVGPGVLHVGLGGFFRGQIGGNVGFGGGDGGLLPGDIGFLLHVFDAGHDLALLDHVAFLDVQVGDAAHGRGAQVDIGLGLDFAGAADDRSQILARDLGSQNLGVSGLLLIDHEGHKSGGHHYGKCYQEDLFHVRCMLQVSPNSVYAITGRPVPDCGQLGRRRLLRSPTAAARMVAEAGKPRKRPGTRRHKKWRLFFGRLTSPAGLKTSSKRRFS